MAALLRRVPAFYPAALIPATRQTRAFSSARVPSLSRTFKDAVTLLDTLQSNKQVAKSISNSGHDANQSAIPEMLGWLHKAGYIREDFEDRLRFIHVAGTKGKGSVCAMVESILLQYKGGARGGQGHQNGLGRIGLYTSPHLITVRERIRIDGAPISEQTFARYFFDLWDRFSSATYPKADSTSIETKPGYFRYLTILALHTFMQEGVETAIIECGIGGEYDSTNILPSKAVTTTAITSLGIDHVGMLGETIEEIAWHKAGIMKRWVPAYTVRQTPQADEVLQRRAREKGVGLTIVERLSSLEDVKLGLEGEFQRDNASLAVTIAASHMRALGIAQEQPESIRRGPLPGKIVTGLENVVWPGRCQVLEDGNITWFLDGAHTRDSIRSAAVWFHGHLLQARRGPNPPTATMLIFNQTDRDGAALLRDLMSELHAISGHCQSPFGRPLLPLYRPGYLFQLGFGSRIFIYAAFPTNTPFRPSSAQAMLDIKAQESLANLYQNLDGNCLHMSYATIEEAVELAKRVSEGDERLIVFVTGSLYLVGGLLEVLKHRQKVIK